MIKNECPACHQASMHPGQVMNALSRYTHAYICSACGIREALEGNFWNAKD